MKKIPLDIVHLFPKLDAALISLLQSLNSDEWATPTIAKKWSVKDIAAHLLDGNMRTISMLQDGYFTPAPVIESYQDLVHFLNDLNAAWVNAMKRVSPQQLILLLADTGKTFYNQLAKLNPFAPAVFSVAWAGEESSENWFHIAREYTEKWLHQQQIRDAVNKPGIMTREFFLPFIDVFMCGLPHTFRQTNATAGTTVQVDINTDIGGSWCVKKQAGDGWKLCDGPACKPAAMVSMDPDTAWKLFSKGLRPENALKKIKIHGDADLGRVVLNMLSVMA